MMVAFVSGNDLGLFNSSLGLLGTAGGAGNAAAGRSGEQAYVNVATGNLVVQRQDELLLGQGPDVALVRTYNSQGQFTDDNWRLGIHKRLYGLTGAVNTAGSTIFRTDADGTELVYTYDAARVLYVNKDGAGSFDTLAYNSRANQWTWTDGDSRITETYDWISGSGKLLGLADLNGNTLTYGYTGNLLTSVTDASNETTYLDHTGNNLSAVRTVASNGATTTRVRYGYDALNRLASVTVDLTPDNNSIADGNVYATTYTYDGNSTRIASISQTDGTQIGFVYTTLADGSTRVTQISQATDGGNRITAIAYDLANGKTTVTDPLGNATVYSYDAQGRLINLTGPAITGSGRQSISYAYDADGNVQAQTDALGNTVSYEYDGNGNLTLQRDAAGNTVARSYGNRNELLAETVYLAPDPDGAGAAQPGQSQTTRYAYDSNNHLRFAVSAEGHVIEYRYNTQGQRIASINYTGSFYDVSGLAVNAAIGEGTLAAWMQSAGVDKAQSMRADMTYDFRGQVDTVTRYAKVDATGGGIADGTQSVTQYVYDQAGQLLKTVTPQGNATTGNPNDGVTTYSYDGLGRLLSSTDALGNVTLHQYDDAGNKVRTVLANGLATTSTSNRAGELISVIQADGTTALGETHYWYDADGRLRMTQDPTGVKQYNLYDEAGRKVAAIDGNGSLTEYVYNANNQVIRTIRHATAVSVANLAGLVDANGNPANVALSSIRPAASAADRSAWNLYDVANRLVKSVDELGYVAETQYDGASRVTATIRYATAINAGAITAVTLATDVALSPAADATNDRRTRTFYDHDGNVLAVLDADGYLTEHQYDAAGRLVHTVSYATQAGSATWSSDPLDQVRPAVDAGNDIHNWTLYDGQGRAIGSVDGEGYLTEVVHDVNGNQTQQIRYANKALIAPDAIATDTTISALRPASSAQDQVTSWTYTDLNQIKSQANAEGTITQYTYDSVGNLVKTDKAFGTGELRTLQAKYDKQGRLIGQLTAEGSAALAALTAPTQAQIDAIWTQYGVSYSYDAAGRKTSSIDQNGNKTLYYYNEDNQLVYVIDALGEVKGNVYNALGQLTQTVRYGTPVASVTLATLTGGLVTDDVTATVNAIANTAADSKVSLAYDLRGQISARTDELGNTSSITYNAFGDTRSSTERINAGATVTTQYDVNRRGMRTQTTEDVGDLNRVAKAVYDAFGRMVQSTDGNSRTTGVQYDRLGRMVQTTDALNISRTTTYDAFDRVFTQTDGNGNVTSTTYDTSTRSVTVTTPEGISVTTSRNRHGETVQVKDGRGNITSYSYDKNGNLASTTNDALGIADSKRYDNANRLIETTDANGVKTAYQYDAANRLLSRTVDPTGLVLKTTYGYDAKGQVVSVTDPNNVVTQTTYDLKGQVTQVAVDPTGLNLRTQYTYDARGKTLKVTEGAGTATARTTQYTYDKLGRRTQETVDPAGLNIATQYAYDDNDNLVKKTDALGNVTRYVYDADNRLVYTVDPLGDVAEMGYDAEGRVTGSVRYAKPIALASLPDVPTLADISSRLAPGSSDEIARTVYDKDGRAAYGINALNQVTQKTYDGNGNVVQVTQYANPITMPSTLTPSTLAAATVAGSNDRITRYVFDAANRLVYSISAVGSVTENIYDANGNLVKTVAYAKLMSVAGNPTLAAMQSTVAANANSAKDRSTRYVLDNANRVVYTIDAIGYVQQRGYDAAGHLVKTIRYAYPSNAGSSPTLASVAALLPANVPASAVVEQQTYDRAGRVVDSIDGAGIVTHHVYDDAGRLTDITQAYGTDAASSTHRFYDAAGRMIAETRAYGTSIAATTRYGYDANGNVVATTDPRGVELAEQDTAWALVSRKVLGYVDAGGSAKTAANLTAAEQQALRALYATTQVFDAAGRKTKVIDALGGATITDYDAFGNAVKITDPLGNSGYFYFDGLNRNTLHVDPEGFVIKTAYTIGGKPASVQQYLYRATGTWDAATVPVVPSTKHQSTIFTYDKLDRLTKVSDAAAFYETYAYDGLGNRISLRNKAGGITTYTYDVRGNLTSETLPITSKNAAGQQAAVVNRYQYDARGNRIKTTEAAGLPEQRITTYDFDALNRQVRKTGEALSVFDPATQTTSSVAPVETQVYDVRGNLIEKKDANGNRTLTYYDTLDRKVAELNATGTLTTYSYISGKEPVASRIYGDSVALPAIAGGTVPTPVNAAKVRKTLYSYDRNERLVSTHIKDASLGSYNAANGQYQLYTADVVTRQTYDAAGNVIQSIDGNGNATTSFYNKIGQKILQVDADGYGIAWTRDVNGNALLERRYASKYPSLVTTGSDAAALLANWPTSSADRITTYVYDRNARLIQENRLSVAYATVDSSGGSFAQATGAATTRYAYNGLGKVIQKTDANGDVTDIAYDSLGRQTREQGAAFTDFEGATVRPTTDTEYDGLNDVARSIRRGKNDASEADDQITTYAYGTGGRLLGQTDPAGATTFAYDAAGNVTRKARPRTNADGATVTDTTLYRYDGLNREIKLTDAGTGVSQETRYNAYGEISAKGTNGGWQEFAEYDRTGHVFKSNSGSGVTRAYVYDAAGNATLSIESSGPDLKAMTLDQMLGLSNGSPDPGALDAAGVHLSVSVFDRRNLLTDTFQPKMVTSHNGEAVQASTTTVQLPPANFTGTTVALGAASQAAAVAASNPAVQGSVAVSTGYVQATRNYTFFPDYTNVDPLTNTIDEPSHHWYDGSVHLTLPAAVSAWGDGNTVVVEQFSDEVHVIESKSYTYPPTQLTIDTPKTLIFYAYFDDIIHTVSVYKQTPYGNVLLAQTSFTYYHGIQSPDSTSTPIPKRIHFKGQSTSTDRLLLFWRPAGTSGPYAIGAVPKYVINGSGVNGWFALDSGWLSGAYDFKYVALDASGNILNQEAGSMSLSASSASILQAPQKYGAAQVNSYFFQSGNVLNLTAQGTNVKSMIAKYRVAGSNSAWTTASIGAAAMAGWFQWNHGSLSGDYEVIFESRTGTGAIINKLYSKVRLNGSAPAFLTAITPYQSLPSTVNFSGNPTDAINLKVSYRTKGSAGAYSVVTLSPTAAGSGKFYWDASALVPYDQTNFQYEFLYEATNAAGKLVNKGGGSLQLGTAPSMLSQYVAPRPPELEFSPVQSGAARMELHYRVKGSTGDYLAVPALSKASDGKFYWDVSALKPGSGSADYEYFHDLFDANGVVLARTPGYFTVGATNSANELKWVVTGLVSGENVIHRSQRTNAFGDVIQEIDGLSHATDFAYNTLGKLTSKLDAQTTATLENGYVKTVRPQTLYYYDRAGQVVGMKDANGNLNTQAWLAGDLQKVRAERHADGGIKASSYDVFGNQRIAVDENNRRTDYTYDSANRLTRIDRPQRGAGTPGYLASRTFDTYQYDAAGNRVAHTDSLGDREKTYFDSLGRVTKTVSYAGRSTSYSYAYVSSILGVGGAAVGGFQKVTTDANGRTLIDKQDVFGHLTWHQDLGGRTFAYKYNNAGWLTSQIGTSQTGSSGQNIAYDYYANGFIKNIRDNAAHTLTSYEYDKEGNKTFEGYVVLNADNATVRDFYQQATITYDALNRVKTVTDPRYTISYEYDAVGNRRRVSSTYHDGVNGNVTSQDYWYKYDSMNRFTVTMGSLSGARATSETATTVSVTRGTTGVALAYDAASQRRQATKSGDDGVAHTETYSYTADGYLEDTNIDGVLRARRVDDALGRVTTYTEYSTAGAVTYSRNSLYDKDNLTSSETTSSGGSTTYYRYADGTLEHTSATESGTTTTYYGYEWWDSAKESTITANPYNADAPGWKSGYAHMVYDVNGHLQEARDEAGDRSLRYITNAEGLIMHRDEIDKGTVSKIHDFYYVDGKRIGDVGSDGPTRVDYVQSLARDRNAKRDYKNYKPISSADFDQNYEPINASYPGATAGSYSVKTGDTLQAIAAQMWGDSSMWYLIADANGLTGSEKLSAGMRLTIPNKVANIHNSSSTFRVYNAGEAIGDTTPTLPDPPPPPGDDGGCGGFAKIIVVIVAVVATVLTAGAAALVMSGGTLSIATAGQLAVMGMSAMSGTFGIAAAAIGGAIGSIASQGAGMMLGVQKDFSWSGVAMSAVGAGIGASGLGANASGALNVTSNLGKTVVGAMAGNAVSQGVAMASGMQRKFDWRGVAASGIGRAAGYGAGQALNGVDSLVWKTATDTVDGGVRSLANGDRPNWGAIAAESFGNALGNSIADGIGRGSQQEPVLGNTFAEDMAARKAGNYWNPEQDGVSSAATFGDDVAQRRAENYWNADKSDVPSTTTAQQAWFDSLTAGDGFAGKPIPSKGYAQQAALSDASAPTASGLKSQADRLNSYADLLNKASDDAYRQGDKTSGDAYRQEAINNAQAASIYSSSASRMIAESQREVSNASTFDPYAPRSESMTVNGKAYGVSVGYISPAAVSAQSSAFVMSDPGTQNYLAAVDYNSERTVNIASLGLGLAGTGFRAANAVSDFWVATRVANMTDAAARSEAASNIWQARQILSDTRPDLTIGERNQIIKAFDLPSFRVNTITSPLTEYRYFDGVDAGLNGRWSTSQWFDTPAERISSLALPNNQATRAATVTLQPGTTVFQGTVAPQFTFGPNLTGGGLQSFNVMGPRAVIKELP